ncbi:MAG: 16S rRNA (uracil(1498)-N(3))-methyltransferase [Cyclobacteriaceae bacterium]|nr:16S rRNA (uracil(1498)-N(3))-methyltransferase [Cyclobacteriaceae bacterium]
MALFFQPNLAAGDHQLSEDDTHHALRVLRLTAGDTVDVTDGRGQLYQVRLSTVKNSRYAFEITGAAPGPRRTARLTVAVAPTKQADRMEWFLEKAVEIGIDQVVWMHCRHSERTSIKPDRMEKIAITAMKQAGHGYLPVLTPMTPFDQVVKGFASAQNFICTVPAAPNDLLLRMARPAADTCVLIGPEGDFSADEVAMAVTAGFQKASLGPHRLRTETAALAACHILNLVQPLSPEARSNQIN